ncbi:Response regulator receiver domain-containing protein [Colwellia chukchiensis]|uniref:Response regulator receiver domain-containing protein n=1 Tax=Colwellia chukchiensis TaxID=641665 RepID=A0A1H7GJ85_9GAMM|nr:response regulator [Colwellia chukchiensis]SEK37032.1 Response regulator receiver domain-containing protein [Colwellia chukchiensis]
MATPLLICDDSNMARKQVARSLPDGWDVDITFASNGLEAIAAIKAGKGDVLLLDLNMPEMDGYQVLEAILKEDLPTVAVVISGDIQPEAHQRVKSLGALDFIKKPVDKNKLTEILLAYGLFNKQELSEPQTDHQTSAATKRDAQPLARAAPVAKPFAAKSDAIMMVNNEMRDCYQEIANVAMGQAGDLLARLLDVFVVLPIPNVNLIEVSELTMALSDVENKEKTSGICQGFIGAGISGEALLILNDSSFQDVAALMKYEQTLDSNIELELLMDMANLLIGACLNGISAQLDMSFSQGHPMVLGQHRQIAELIASNTKKWQKTLAIEISYSIENYPIKCDLLLLFTEESVATLNNKIAYLLD